MAEIKSCENCGWNNAWKDGNSCPFYNVNMCDSKKLKMWVRKTSGDENKPEYFNEYHNEFIKPKIMTNKEAAYILKRNLDYVIVMTARGNGKTDNTLKTIEALHKAIEVLNKTPD